jgi:hypothetical protein
MKFKARAYSRKELESVGLVEDTERAVEFYKFHYFLDVTEKYVFERDSQGLFHFIRKARR